jgi:hypothetical protein
LTITTSSSGDDETRLSGVILNQLIVQQRTPEVDFNQTPVG